MDELMSLATGLIARETRRVETAAQNVANTATPGYKRAIAFQDVLAAQTATDFSAGKPVHTGNPLDLALSSAGFLEVMAPQGPLYTRQGSFHRDADGRLVTVQGWPLQAASGGDVVLASDQAQITSDGAVLDAGTPSQTLRVAQFADPSRLQRIGEGLFAPGDQDVLDSERPPQVTPGYLEASNATAGDDMVQVMDAMRQVEAGQKIVHAYDDMIGSVLQHLGEM